LLALQNVSGWLGQVFYLVGPSGAGKTTIGRIIAASVAEPIATTEIDAQDLTMEFLREAERTASFRPLGGKGWAYLVNEAHGMSGKVVSRLQTVLESPQIQKNTTWIFTTTNVGNQKLFDNMDACPFLSRAKTYTLKTDDETQEAIVQYVAKVALEFDLNGQPLRAYWQLGQDCKFNVREMLQKVEAGCMLE
jgi:replication-associated recombination protein RarA